MGLNMKGGGQSFPFVAPGDFVKGKVTKTSEQQQESVPDKNGNTELQWWDAAKTRPKMMGVVELDVIDFKTSGDPLEDTKHVTLFVSGGRWSAISAVTDSIEDGSILRLEFEKYSDQKPPPGHSPAKRYVAEYTAPSLDMTQGKEAAPPNGAAHGPKPDNIPQAAWDVMDTAARAAVSPPVAAAAHGPRPDYIPQAAWDVMDTAARAAVSPPAAAGPVKPDYLPQAAWDAMDDAARAKLVAA